LILASCIVRLSSTNNFGVHTPVSNLIEMCLVSGMKHASYGLV